MDKYDEQIAELTEHPTRIKHSWAFGIGLFKVIGTNVRVEDKVYYSGCLTMIRNPRQLGDDAPLRFAVINGIPDEILTREIVADERIPRHPVDITPDDFPVFAEWQRRIDKLQNPQNESTPETQT